MKAVLSLVLLVSLLSVVFSQNGYRQDFFLVFTGYYTANVDGTGGSAGTANSLGAQTLISQNYGLEYTENTFIGPKAYLTSTYKTVGKSQWTETGNITFGPTHFNQPHALYFSLISYADLYDFKNGESFMAGFYNVTGGYGAFRGAFGIISVTIRTNSTEGTFVGHYFGEVILPDRLTNNGK